MRFKNVIDSMIVWGETHPQVKKILWGKIDELQNLANYPCVFIVPTPSQISTNQYTHKFDIYFLDKLRHDNKNREDVFNSMQLLATDFLNHYDLNWFNENGFYIESPTDYDLVDGDLEDFVGGIILSVNCISNYDINCLAPSYPTPTPPTPACVCPTGTYKLLSSYYDSIYFGYDIYTLQGNLIPLMDGTNSYNITQCDGTPVVNAALFFDATSIPSWYDSVLDETHMYANAGAFTFDTAVTYCLSAYTTPCICSDSGYATVEDITVVDPAAINYSYYVTVDGDYSTVITGHTKMSIYSCSQTQTLFTNKDITSVVYDSINQNTILTVYTINGIIVTPGEHYCADIDEDPSFNAIIYGYSGVTGGIASVSNFPTDIRSGVTIGKEYKAYGNVNDNYEYSVELNVTDVTYNSGTDVTRVTFAEGGSTPLSANTPVIIGKMEKVWGTLQFTYFSTINMNVYSDSTLIAYSVGGNETAKFIVGDYAYVTNQIGKAGRYQEIMQVTYVTDPTPGYDHTNIICAGGVMQDAYYIYNNELI